MFRLPARKSVLLPFAIAATGFSFAAASPAHAAAPAKARAASSACKGADVLPTRANAPAVRKATLCLLNRERASHKLPRLRWNARLRRAATGHSANMVRTDFFDHTTPTGISMSQRILRSGYVKPGHAASFGENLGWGSGAMATPKAMVAAWMASPGHRANILDGRFRDIGIGVVTGAPRPVSASSIAAVYTTDFGKLR